MNYLKGRRILVTGGAGFLGTEVCKLLQASAPDEVVVPRQAQFDLRDPSALSSLFVQSRPEVVIHLAAVVPVPFREDDLWNGYPDETNAPYGLAKKMLLVQSQAYRQQYGFNAIHLLPVNLYGPGDNFNLDTSHVIPALIRKTVEARNAGQSEFAAWGTGSVSREFLFVRDAAQAVVQATELYNKPEPVNVGAGREMTIKELAELICRLGGFKGTIRWDSSKPDGQPRRCLDTTRAAQEFGFVATTPLEEGLAETIRWYQDHRQ